MNRTSWIAYRFLIEKNRPNKQSEFMRYTPEGEWEKLSETPLPETDPFSHFIPLENRLKAIHYSWLITFLEPFSEPDKEKILSALDPIQAKKLQSHFKIKGPLMRLSPHAKRFLNFSIYGWLISEQKEFVLREFLPAHPLNLILDLKKQEIQHLVNLLGLHDLALEMKKIIKSEQIKKIYRTLSKIERDYLKILLKEREPVSFARLNLEGWDGNQQKLKKVLHHRGFNRLAKSLFGCHPSLTWYLTHKLDTGRSKIFRKFFTDINNSQAQDALINQVVKLISFIRKHYE